MQVRASTELQIHSHGDVATLAFGPMLEVDHNANLEQVKHLAQMLSVPESDLLV